MIIYINVCDHCGSQTEIESERDLCGIEVSLIVDDVKDTVKGGHVRYRDAPFKATFCDRECMLSYFKENLDPSGFFKDVIEDKKKKLKEAKLISADSAMYKDLEIA